MWWADLILNSGNAIHDWSEGDVYVFSIKQKRTFQSILSGLKFATYGNKEVRFVTLTTSDVCADSFGYNDNVLNDHFQILAKTIKRYCPYRLYDEGFISHNQLVFYFGRDAREWIKPFTFEYVKVRTDEGGGLLHLCYRGKWLPYCFLSSLWMEIHNSWNVSISLVDTSARGCKWVASYLVAQYMSGQGSAYVRSSMTSNWVFRGFKSMWYLMKRDYGSQAFQLWDEILKKRALAIFFSQARLGDYG